MRYINVKHGNLISGINFNIINIVIKQHTKHNLSWFKFNISQRNWYGGRESCKQHTQNSSA